MQHKMTVSSSVADVNGRRYACRLKCCWADRIALSVRRSCVQITNRCTHLRSGLVTRILQMQKRDVVRKEQAGMISVSKVSTCLGKQQRTRRIKGLLVGQSVVKVALRSNSIVGQHRQKAPRVTVRGGFQPKPNATNNCNTIAFGYRCLTRKVCDMVARRWSRRWLCRLWRTYLRICARRRFLLKAGGQFWRIHNIH